MRTITIPHHPMDYNHGETNRFFFFFFGLPVFHLFHYFPILPGTRHEEQEVVATGSGTLDSDGFRPLEKCNAKKNKNPEKISPGQRRRTSKNYGDKTRRAPSADFHHFFFFFFFHRFLASEKKCRSDFPNLWPARCFT